MIKSTLIILTSIILTYGFQLLCAATVIHGESKICSLLQIENCKF